MLPPEPQGFKIIIVDKITCPSCGSPHSPRNKKTGLMAHHESPDRAFCPGIGQEPKIFYTTAIVQYAEIRRHLHGVDPKKVNAFIDSLRGLSPDICGHVLSEVMKLTGNELSRSIQSWLDAGDE